VEKVKKALYIPGGQNYYDKECKVGIQKLAAKINKLLGKRKDRKFIALAAVPLCSVCPQSRKASL